MSALCGTHFRCVDGELLASLLPPPWVWGVVGFNFPQRILFLLRFVGWLVCQQVYSKHCGRNFVTYFSLDKEQAEIYRVIWL